MPDERDEVENLNLNPHQVAEVIATRPDGHVRGSGYLIASGRVLTAAHVVDQAIEICVRFDADSSTEWSSSADLLDAAGDLAILVLRHQDDRVQVMTPVFGSLPDQGAMIRVHAMGFPIFKLRREMALTGTQICYRDTHHARGWSSILSGRREGTLEISLSAADFPDKLPSPWEGMSGAAVWHRDHLIGVVSYHDHEEGISRLTATRIDKTLARLDDGRRHIVESRLGIIDSLFEAITISLPSASSLTQAADFSAPGGLVGREEELASLASFCVDDEAYLWVKGDPWAGKTALLAAFSLCPPQDCDVISYFVNRRVNGPSDSSTFDDALLGQLSELVGVPLPTQLNLHARGSWRRRLFQRASERARAKRRTLLILVDGLDEDMLDNRTQPIPSIASILPKQPPPGLKVLVSSRNHPPLARDVPPDHPLRTCRVLRLANSPVARDMRDTATVEIDTMLGSHGTGRAVLCFLAAARAGLSVEELSTLIGEPIFAVDAVLRSALGRSVTDRESVSRLGVSSRVYVFAHDTLQELALCRTGRALLAEFESQLISWISSYASRGWPQDTPQFAGTGYFGLLKRRGEFATILAVVTDPLRQQFLRRLFGGDQSALLEIEVAQELSNGLREPNLGVLARLAFHRERLNKLDSRVPSELPALFERLGMTTRAWWAIRSIPVAAARDKALSLLGLTLAHMDAVDRAEWIVSSIGNNGIRQETLVSLAEVYGANPGWGDRVLRLLDLIESQELRMTALTSLLRHLSSTASVTELRLLAERFLPRDRLDDGVMAAMAAMVSSGRWDEARNLSAVFVSRQRRQQARLLIARRLLELGRRDEAWELLDDVRDELGDSTVGKADPINADLASLYTLIDRREDALICMSRISDQRRHAEAITDFACFLAARGETVEAEEWIARITGIEDAVRARLEFIGVIDESQSDLIERMVEAILSKLRELPGRQMSLGVELTAVLARSGRPESVERVVSTLDINRAAGYSTAARAAHRAGRSVDASVYVARVKDVELRIATVIALARQCVVDDDHSRAISLSADAVRLAAVFEDSRVMSETLAATGGILLDCGDRDAARLAALRSEELSRSHAVGGVFSATAGQLAVEFATRGDWTRGFELVRRVPTDMRGVIGLGLIRAAATSDNEETKRSTVSVLSSEWMTEAKNSGQRVVRMGALAQLSTQLGDLELGNWLRARIVEELLSSPRAVDRFRLWVSLNQFSKDIALYTLERVKEFLPDLPECPLRLEVLRALARLGEFDLALAGVPDRPNDVSVRSLSALVLPGETPDRVTGLLLRHLRAPNSPLSPTALMDGIGALLHVGRTTEARDIFFGLGPSRERDEILIDLVCALFTVGQIDEGKECFAQKPPSTDPMDSWIEIGAVLVRKHQVLAARTALTIVDELFSSVTEPASIVSMRAARAMVLFKAGLIHDGRAELAKAELAAFQLDKSRARSAWAQIGSAWAGVGAWADLGRLLELFGLHGDLSLLEAILMMVNGVKRSVSVPDRAAFRQLLASGLTSLPLSSLLPLLHAAPIEVLDALVEEVITAEARHPDFENPAT